MQYYEISSEWSWPWGKENEMDLERLAGMKAVVIFSVSSCCMCHAIKRLFCGMGVSPTVYELDHLHSPHLRTQMENALIALQRGPTTTTTPTPTPTSPVLAVPVVFVGGRLVGGMDRVMASHINGTLVPLLKEAGALWL